jgi:hypothetical protein
VLAAVVALVVTGPVLGPGFVLLRDMVFVPRQDLDADALGLGGGLPRAVPVDAVMGLLTAVVPGDVVQKAVLLLVVFAAVLGAARLVPAAGDGRRGVAGLGAGLVYGWNPYVAERLLIGHWSLLVGYAALPWIAKAALRVRAGERAALAPLVLACAAAALTPTGAVLGAGVALLLVGRQRLLLVAGALAVLSSPWVVAGLLHPGGSASDVGGVAAFAARGESWAGPVVALLGGGGLWNGDAVPASRETALAPLLTALVVALAVVGWRTTEWRGRVGTRLLLLAGGGLLLALAGTAPGLRQLLELVVDTVPGAGLLRDAQKWIAWWLLPLAVGAGLGVRRLGSLLRDRVGPAGAAPVVGAALLLPVLAVPDLAWGVAGRLEPVAYPADWQRVRDALAAEDGPGDVLVLPFGAYRAFEWNERRPQLDPAPRWLPRPAVVDDTLVVGGRPVEGEDPRARAASAAAGDPDRLAELGIGWVLVEHGTPGRDTPGAVSDLPVVVEGPELTLHRVPGAVDTPAAHLVRVISVGVAHAWALGLVVGVVLCMIVRASTVPLRRPPSRKRDPE